MIRLFLVGVTGMALLLPGCTTAPQRGKLERRLDVDAMSARQLDLLVGDYANTFADTVKLSADKIEYQSIGLPARRAALQWKIRAVPAVYTAASHGDPLFSLADLWVLAIQQHDFFARDDMAQVLGEGQSIAVAASRLLVEQIESVAKGTLKSPTGFATLETFVRNFSAMHPIMDLSFMRVSLTPNYVKFVSDESSLRAEVAAVRGYAETALALALVGLNHVPEIARWQAELTLLDAETYPVVVRTTKSIDALGVAAVDLTAIANGLPAMVDAQRDALLRDIERQRVETLRDIELMRRAAFIDVAREREVVLAELETQIQVVINAANQQREIVMSELPAVAERAGEAMLPLTRDVIDHAFWRAAQLLAMLTVLVIVAVVLLRWTRARAGH